MSINIRKKFTKQQTKRTNDIKIKKQKLKQQLQQELLANYYLSKYQNHMARLSDRASSNLYNQKSIYMTNSLSKKSDRSYKSPNKSQRNHKSQSKNSNQNNKSIEKNVINFKHLILQKKNARKNFKDQLKKRNSQSKQKNTKYQMFHVVKQSINQQLQSKIPTQIQSGQYYSVQVMSKTIPVYHKKNNTLENPNNTRIYSKGQSFYLSQNSSKLQSSFIAAPQQIQQNIQIKESNDFQEDSFDQYQQQNQHKYNYKDNHQRKLVEQGIKATFQRRVQKTPSKQKNSPNKSRLSSPGQKVRRIQSPRSKGKNQTYNRNINHASAKKYPSKFSPNKKANSPTSSHHSPKADQNYPKYPQIDQVSQSSINKRRKQSSVNSSQRKDHRKVSSQNISEIQPIELINQYQNQMKQNQKFSFLQDPDQQLSFSKNSSYLQNQQNDEQNKQGKQNSSFGNSNFLKNLDESQKPNQNISQVLDQQIKKNYSPPQDLPSRQLRQSTHDLSTISRFSMTSEEGTIIKQNLCKQIDENQFGPYQNALADLRDLIEDYPNAWPIFVVGQRMLEDRKQYEVKKTNQANQMNQIKQQIVIKNKQNKQFQNRIRKKAGNNQIAENQIRILKLVRQLSHKL